MATYAELLDIATTSTGAALKDKIKIAVMVATDIIRHGRLNVRIGLGL